MRKSFFTAIIVTICVVGIVQAQEPGARQGGGRRGGGQGPARGAGGNLVPSDAQFQSPEAQRHVAAAMKIAGTDLVAEAKVFCTPTGPVRTAVARQAAGLPPEPDRPIEPLRIFENLYYLGLNDVGAWVIPTSAGIILFDALNNTEEARDVIVAGMKKVGLDPAQIKYLVVGHSHNDHTGGGVYIQNTFGPRVLMSALDWETVVAGGRPDRPAMKRDMDVTDGQRLTLGDTTVTFLMTPGHTPGTFAMMFPAKHQGRTHNALILSGMQIPSTQSLSAWEHVFNDVARKQNAETAVAGHPNMAINSMALMQSIGKQYPSGPHPFLYGPERFGRYMDIMLTCGRARLAALASPAP